MCLLQINLGNLDPLTHCVQAAMTQHLRQGKDVSAQILLYFERSASAIREIK